jgi:hypothetical protein
MLFVIITLVIVATVFLTLKKKIDKPSATPVHSPVEEIEASNVPEESYVETVPTVEVVPTTPPSAPTMTAKKKKKPQPKKKPAKVNA